MGLTSPHKHIKIHLHMKQFSPKTNWRLAERLDYNWLCKKDPSGIRQESGRKLIRCWPVPVGRDSEEKGNCTGRNPPWGMSDSGTCGVSMSWDLTLEDKSPLLVGWPEGFIGGLWEVWNLLIRTVQFSSVIWSCLTLWDPRDPSMPGLPVHHQLPEFTQGHVHWVSDTIQPSHPLSSPFPPAFNLSQHQGLLQWVCSSHQVAKILVFQLQHQSFQWILRTDLL